MVSYVLKLQTLKFELFIDRWTRQRKKLHAPLTSNNINPLSSVIFATLKINYRQILSLFSFDCHQYLSIRLQQRLIVHLIQSILHVIQVFFGYLLMLAFMTYNTLICVSVLLGYGFGYFLFAWMTPAAEDGDDADCCNM